MPSSISAARFKGFVFAVPAAGRYYDGLAATEFERLSGGVSLVRRETKKLSRR